MKEFSNKIMVCPVNELPTTIATPFTGFDMLHSNIDIDPQANQKQFNGNDGYEFKLRSTFSDLTDAIRTKYKNSRPLVLILFDTNGNSYQVGSSEIPIFVEINNTKLASELNFYGNLIHSPF